MDTRTQSRTFHRSSALFDRDGNLTEWDAGFELEFEIAGALITPGTSYNEILRFLYANHPRAMAKVAIEGDEDETQRRIEKRIEHLGRETEFDYVNSDGHTVQVCQTLTPSGGFLRAARNVTIQRRGEKAIAEARLREGIVVTEVPIWLRRDVNGNFAYPPVTPEMKGIMGVPPDFDTSDPMSLYSRIEQTPEELARYGEAMALSMRTMSVFNTDFRLHDTNGALRWIRTTMSPSVEADGSIVWTGVMNDVTRERTSEGQLELLRSAIVHSADALIIFETDPSLTPRSKVLYANPEFERLAGCTGAEILDKGMAAFSIAAKVKLDLLMS